MMTDAAKSAALARVAVEFAGELRKA
jgi:hypothetical protein